MSEYLVVFYTSHGGLARAFINAPPLLNQQIIENIERELDISSREHLRVAIINIVKLNDGEESVV